MGDLVQIAGTVLGAETRIRIPRGSLPMYIPQETQSGLHQNPMRIVVQGVVAA